MNKHVKTAILEGLILAIFMGVFFTIAFGILIGIISGIVLGAVFALIMGAFSGRQSKKFDGIRSEIQKRKKFYTTMGHIIIWVANLLAAGCF